MVAEGIVDEDDGDGSDASMMLSDLEISPMVAEVIVEEDDDDGSAASLVLCEL